MKPHLTVFIGLTSRRLGRQRPKLQPRTTCPTLSIVPLHRGPLRKLAWIFGFGR